METKEAIQNFSKQFEYRPIIENDGGFVPPKYGRYIFCGMGGSALAPDLLRVWNPSLDIIVHRDYGLPSLLDEILKNCLIVVNSYSGNTEEALSAFNLAVEKRLPVAAITIGGKLLELAQKNSVPYIQMPNLELEPRMALGLNFRALLKIIGADTVLKETDALTKELIPESLEVAGKEIAGKIGDAVPIIYSSRRNGPLAYAWKVIFNETAKIPAFSNVLPELNHNEMVGFELPELPEKFHFIFLNDSGDEPQIQKRAAAAALLFRGKGFAVTEINISHNDVFLKIFETLFAAYWAAYYAAPERGASPDGVPLIEKFKRLIG